MLKDAEEAAAKQIEDAKKASMDMMKQHLEKMKAQSEVAAAA